LPVNTIEGTTVYLLGCEAYTEDGFAICLIGLFDIVEYHSYEPSAYIFSSGYTVCPEGSDEGPDYFVDAYVLQAHIDPKSYALDLALEREAGFAEEREW
jgi:hypothetical protein